MTRLAEEEVQEYDAALARATHSWSAVSFLTSSLQASRAAAVEEGEEDGDQHHPPLLLHGQEKPGRLH